MWPAPKGKDAITKVEDHLFECDDSVQLRILRGGANAALKALQEPANLQGNRIHLTDDATREEITVSTT